MLGRQDSDLNLSLTARMQGEHAGAPRAQDARSWACSCAAWRGTVQELARRRPWSSSPLPRSNPAGRSLCLEVTSSETGSALVPGQEHCAALARPPRALRLCDPRLTAELADLTPT